MYFLSVQNQLRKPQSQPDLDIKTRNGPFALPQQTSQPTQSYPRALRQTRRQGRRRQPPPCFLQRRACQRGDGVVDCRAQEFRHCGVVFPMLSANDP